MSLERESVVTGGSSLRVAHVSCNLHIVILAEASLLESDVHVQRIVFTLLEVIEISLFVTSDVVLRILQLNLVEASALATIDVAKLVLVDERLHFV